MPTESSQFPGERGGALPGGGGLGVHRAAGGIGEQHPALDQPGQRGDDGGGAVRVERGPGQDVLGVVRGGEGLVLLSGDRAGHGLGDRQERHRPRHGQQRQPLLDAGPPQRRRHRAVHNADPEPQPDHAHLDQPPDVGDQVFGPTSATQAEAGDEQEFAALQVLGRVLQLAHVHPADLGAEPIVAGVHGQAERRVGHELGEGERHPVRVVGRHGQQAGSTCSFVPSDGDDPESYGEAAERSRTGGQP